MQSLTIIDRMAGRDPAEIALAAGGRRLTVGEMRVPPAAAADAAASASVAVMLRDPLALVWSIAALDGAVERMLLLPHGTPSAIAGDLVAQSRATVLLTDLSDVSAGECRVVRWAQPGLNGSLASPSARSLATQWLIATSGTTGTPKLVGHSLASLTRTTNPSRRSGDPHRWGELYDVCRFAGLQVMLQALLGGCPLILPEPDAPLDGKLRLLIDEGCTALSATPTLWRQILMSPLAPQLALRQITLGGEIVDGAILAALRRTYPAARIVHIYASTEAGAAFAVDDGQAGFPARFIEAPPKGVRLAVRDGILKIENAEVRPSYVGSDDSFADADSFVDTGDLVTLRDGRYYFLGRASGCINVGGNKVMPEEVEAVLLDHPAVALARVAAKPSPITGSLVTAEIVAAAGCADPTALAGSLRAFCGERLEKWKVPALIRIVDSLAANSSGKLQR